MNRLRLLRNWCRSLLMTEANNAQCREVSLALIEAASQIARERTGSQNAKKWPPLYLVLPPGREGRRKRMLLGLNDDES